MLFLAVAERCEEILEETGVTDKVQLATFHPEYHFAGEEVGDPGSYTNRSPYPTVHLLRSVDVSRAVDAHPDTESIPEANIERLRAVGAKRCSRGSGNSRRGEVDDVAIYTKGTKYRPLAKRSSVTHP